MIHCEPLIFTVDRWVLQEQQEQNTACFWLERAHLS